MADIAVKDVVVTQTSNDEDYSGQRINRMFPKIAFGDGSMTYPTYGIPVPDISQFRLKQFIKRLYIQQPPDGYEYRYDPTVRTANPVAPYGTIRIFQGNGGTVSGATFTGTPLAAHTHDLLVKGGITADEALGVLSSGPTLGKAAAVDRTVAGASVATKGGVVGVSAGTPAGSLSGTIAITSGPLTELGNVALVATELKLEILGA